MTGPDASPDRAQVSASELVTLAETFRLLGDPSRLRILLHCIDTPRAVSDMATALGMSQSLVSHHLRLLRAARLVSGKRKSRQIFYRVSDDHVGHVLRDMLVHIREDHGLGQDCAAQ